MTITLEPELERKVQEVATRAGLGVNEYVSATLLQHLQVQDVAGMDKQARDEYLRREFEEAMSDPLFVQDMEETMEAFKYIDAETARMLDAEEAAA